MRALIPPALDEIAVSGADSDSRRQSSGIAAPKVRPVESGESVRRPLNNAATRPVNEKPRRPLRATGSSRGETNKPKQPANLRGQSKESGSMSTDTRFSENSKPAQRPLSTGAAA